MIGMVRAALALPEGMIRLINGLDHVHHADGRHLSEPFHPFRQVVENGVDDKPFFQYHDNTACKADYQAALIMSCIRPETV